MPARTPAPASTGHASQNLQELSRGAVRLALEGSRGNVSQAARSLGISRQTLYRKISAQGWAGS